MEQGEARERAREISETSGRVAVADTIRRTRSGRLIRGGWPHPEQAWAVFDYETGELIEI